MENGAKVHKIREFSLIAVAALSLTSGCSMLPWKGRGANLAWDRRIQSGRRLKPGITTGGGAAPKLGVTRYSSHADSIAARHL